MNCDYVIELCGEPVFIEIAGLATESKNKSSVELDYERRLKEKLSMLESSNLNYHIIYPKDFKAKSLDEIFSFLHSKQPITV